MGELLALASALTFSITAVIEKSLTRRFAPPYLAALGSLGGALFMLVIMFALGKGREIPDAPMGSILLSITGGVLSIAIGYSMYLVFLRSVDVSKAAPVSQGLFAVLAVISGLFILGEVVSWFTFIGIAAMVAGLYTLSIAQRSQSVSTEARWLGFKGLAFMVLVASFWVAGFSLQKKALEHLDVVIANGLRLPVVFFFLAAFASLRLSRSLVSPDLEEPDTEAQASAPIPTGVEVRPESSFEVKGSASTGVVYMKEVTGQQPGLTVIILTILNGSASFGLGSLLLLMALERAGLAITMVLNNTSLLFIVLFSTVFLRERLTRKTIIGVIVTVTGVVMVVL